MLISARAYITWSCWLAQKSTKYVFCNAYAGGGGVYGACAARWCLGGQRNVPQTDIRAGSIKLTEGRARDFQFSRTAFASVPTDIDLRKTKRQQFQKAGNLCLPRPHGSAGVTERELAQKAAVCSSEVLPQLEQAAPRRLQMLG